MPFSFFLFSMCVYIYKLEELLLCHVAYVFKKTSAVEALNDFIFTVPYLKTIQSAIPAEQKCNESFCDRLTDVCVY